MSGAVFVSRRFARLVGDDGQLLIEFVHRSGCLNERGIMLRAEGFNLIFNVGFVIGDMGRNFQKLFCHTPADGYRHGEA